MNWKKLKKVLDKRKQLWYIRWAVAETAKKKSQRTLIIEQYNQPWRFLKKPKRESEEASEISERSKNYNLKNSKVPKGTKRTGMR